MSWSGWSKGTFIVIYKPGMRHAARFDPTRSNRGSHSAGAQSPLSHDCHKARAASTPARTVAAQQPRGNASRLLATAALTSIIVL
jgi:hypothetical protein